jgi:hypothetical protein
MKKHKNAVHQPAIGPQVAVIAADGIELSNAGEVTAVNPCNGIISVKVWQDAPYRCPFKYSNTRRRWESACLSHDGERFVFHSTKEHLVY